MIPKISVIVAVYNAEKYLHRSVDSLLAQTFRDFEILLVDDGSLDNSKQICDEYAVLDSRIRVFHKKNGGVSSTRQYGKERAQGDYIIHVDPDDWVELDMLEKLYQNALDTSADIVICDYFINTNIAQKYIRQAPSVLDANTVLIEFFRHLHGSCCNKLVRRKFCEDIYFPKDINFCEDLIFSVCLLKKKPQISYLPKAFYHYQIDVEGSIVKSVDKSTINADLHLYDYFISLFKNDILLLDCFKRSFSLIIVERSFCSHVLSSKEFAEIYGPFKYYIFINKQRSFLFKILCYMSCIGYYRIMYNIYLFLNFVKKVTFNLKYRVI